ncbi:GTP cyclohydrolase II [Parasphingopyxis marina]|uniref:GTP cyclohydrolase-2 n=1 Tax=Parasphingopyxis marina TaxID=2761622 RepID=A0A842HXS5_9SPHN|nr:GTP cyclohydrolase II [Parasphingopyxis marina]MBC2776304.1 GTP cyclohydrolase II [Parasphingopyxis marina]
MSDGSAPPGESRKVARAIDALRRGWPAALADETGAIRVLAIETATAESLAAFDGSALADIMIGAGRAETLKLANQLEAARPGAPVRVRREAWHDLSAATAIADPAFDLKEPLKGPFRALAVQYPEASAAALKLARLAGLLPAVFVTAGEAADAVTAADIEAYDDPAGLTIAARAKLPVATAEKAEIVAFRHQADAAEHIALLIGSPSGTPPLVRLHSECLTGDVLASLKCDCGPQLQGALAAMAEEGWGILLYLRQEGRGIGLVNKLRAYALQDQGFDTVDANTRLGFAIDERDFRVAARMLELLGQSGVRLLTNNPEKVAGLEAAGITVTERVPHKHGENPHNAHYLSTKRDRTGHQL